MTDEQKTVPTKNPEDIVIPPTVTTEYINETRTDIPKPDYNIIMTEEMKL